MSVTPYQLEVMKEASKVVLAIWEFQMLYGIPIRLAIGELPTFSEAAHNGFLRIMGEMARIQEQEIEAGRKVGNKGLADLLGVK